MRWTVAASTAPSNGCAGQTNGRRRASIDRIGTARPAAVRPDRDVSCAARATMTNRIERSLIVNADDFGLSEGVNRGILQAHDEGIVTSASLMVRQPAAAAAAEEAGRRPGLSVGLHLDLGSGYIATAPGRHCTRSPPPTMLRASLRRWRASSTHLCTWSAVTPPTSTRTSTCTGANLCTAAQHMAARLRIPLRHFAPGVTYCGDFYGQGGRGEPFPELITPAVLTRIIRSLANGLTELGCHPGDAVASMAIWRRADDRSTHAVRS